MLFEATIYNILWQAADASTDNKSSLQKRIYKLYCMWTWTPLYCTSVLVSRIICLKD